MGAGAEGPPGAGEARGGENYDGHPFPTDPPPHAPDFPGTSPSENFSAASPSNPEDMSPADAFLSLIQRYRHDPVGFVQTVLGAKPLDWQCDFLRQLAAGERRLSIRAGHGVGKSTAMSWGLLWHALTRYPQKALVTAPTSAQLFDALFSELKRWINALPPYARVLLNVTSDRVELKAAPDESFISARTASVERPEALSGVHSEHVLLIADEAPGVPEAIFENAIGAMSGESACTVLIGNPTRNSGFFFKTHHDLKRPDGAPPGSDGWFTMVVSCLDNPLVSQDFVKQVRDTYGEGSNAYRVRVLGEFPLADDDTLIPAELVDAAMARDVQANPAEPLVYGIDPARFGDDRSVILRRRGNVVPDFRSFRGLDTMQLVGQVVAQAIADVSAGNVIAEINVDSIGIGSGVADRLREIQGSIPQLHGVQIRDVNVAETSALNPQANRLRDELWLSVKEWLTQRACSLPKSDDLRQDLVSPTFKFASSGKIVVEPKSEMKKRGLKSPDIADALCLTFAGAGALVGGRASRWVPGVPLRMNRKGVV